jgi:hypothetical protein
MLGVCWLKEGVLRDVLVSGEQSGDDVWCGVFAICDCIAPRPSSASCPFISIARRATKT